MNRNANVTTDIVLLGGGHAHVHVLKAFTMRPEPGVRLTLVTRDLETPYSGMLPGVIAGLYTAQQAHIDLLRLSSATGTRLIHAEAIGLDRERKSVLFAGRPPIAYDIVSIDVGITPALAPIEGAAEFGVAVKPIGSFLEKLETLLARCRSPDGPRRFAVIGGGAGGVELLLSLRSRLIAVAPAEGGSDFSFTLITADEILASHNSRVRDAFRRVLEAKGIALHEHRPARALRPGAILLEGGALIEADVVLVTTEAAAPAWFVGTGLALDAGGFLAVGPTLQALNDPDVFAAGDCAALVETPREKAGVFAVRAGPPLAENLRRRTRGDALREWQPQRRHLSLITTGERYAVASWGRLKTEGRWVWWLKDWIDRRWMKKYQDVETLLERMSRRPVAASDAAATLEAMRCGGCGAKVGPGPLSRALARLSPALGQGVVVGLDRPDDAAVFAPPTGSHLVQTVDFLRTFIDDEFVFAEIAANHALNDVFAMGGVPRHALAIASVPQGTAQKVEETLFQLLAGARSCFDRERVGLLGGHSSEGSDLAVGFSLTGEVSPERVLLKTGLRSGDVLVLTKPLGTGILFAAAMRARARAPWIAVALSEMRRSGGKAARILLDHGATAMTDVSGFGLGGHLGEMLTASGVDADIDLAALPLFEGVLTLARQGIASSLLAENLSASRFLGADVDEASRAILFDPQTSGGLLAGIPAAQADDCVKALRAAGYATATAIGRVVREKLSPAEVRINPHTQPVVAQFAAEPMTVPA